MGSHHHHHHHHSVSKNLRLAFFLNLTFTVFEFFGGMYTNSVALTSDAVHDLGDTLSIGTAWGLQIISHRKPDKNFSFGYARFSLLGALINSVVLIIGSVFVVSHAVERLMHPEHSDGGGMILFAIVGIAVNGFAAWKLMGGKSLNERVVSWHLIEDVLGWVAVLVAAIVIYFYDVEYIDPALSLLIAAYILYGVFRRLKETLFVFLQGTPEGVDLIEIEHRITALERVHSVHETRVWSLEGEHHVFTAHVKLHNVNSLGELKQVRAEVQTLLKPYKFTHCTVETELDSESCFMDHD